MDLVALLMLIADQWDHPYPQLPLYEYCKNASSQACQDHQELAAAVPWVSWWCHYRVIEVIDARDESYRLWDVWHYAAQLRGSRCRCEEAERRLIGLVGEDRFRRGDLPLPLSWR